MHNLCTAHTHKHTHSCSCQKRKCMEKIITATFHTLHIKFERRRADAALRIDEHVFLSHFPFSSSSFSLLLLPSTPSKRMCHFIGHLLPAPAWPCPCSCPSPAPVPATVPAPVPAPPNTNVCLVALPSSRTSGAWLARQTNKEKYVPWPWYLWPPPAAAQAAAVRQGRLHTHLTWVLDLWDQRSPAMAALLRTTLLPVGSFYSNGFFGTSCCCYWCCCCHCLTLSPPTVEFEPVASHRVASCLVSCRLRPGSISALSVAPLSPC